MATKTIFQENEVYVSPSQLTRVGIIKIWENGMVLIGGKSPKSEALMLTVENMEDLVDQFTDYRLPHRPFFLKNLGTQPEIIQTICTEAVELFAKNRMIISGLNEKIFQEILDIVEMKTRPIDQWAAASSNTAGGSKGEKA